MSEQIYVSARVVEPGCYIPGLDNAYVIEVDTDFDIRDGSNNASFGDGCVLITYNDNVGNEGYLLLTPDTRIEVLRQ